MKHMMPEKDMPMKHMADMMGEMHNYLGRFKNRKVMRDGHNTVPNPKAPLGQGGRFAAIEAKARVSGARNPAAVAAAAGIKKYGKKKMARMAAAGRKG